MEQDLETVEDVVNRVMPDRGLSIQFGGMLAGLAENPDDELMHIFDQSVISQYPQPYKRGRDDEDVWLYYKKSLSEKRIDKHLEPKRFISEAYEYKFEHAFKNEKWHVLKPVNMDYAQSHTIQDRATRVLGEASALDGNPELSMYYILLGEPRENSHKSSYIKAKNLLNKIPIKKEIIEEDGAEHFADYLADYMEKHGVIQETPNEK